MYQLIESIENAGYRQEDSIHCPGAVEFQARVLNAPVWIVETLRSGLDLVTGNKFPKSYYEKNNKSATANMKEMARKFEEYEEKGVVEKLTEKPRFCNPLTMAVKMTEKGPKYRPVIDMSRCVNERLPDRTIKLSDLSFFEPFLEKNCYMCTYDMSSMYHQLRLDSKTSEIFGCMVYDEKGEAKFYKFLVLAFGCSIAVYIMSKILGTAQDFFRGLSIRTGSFIDDGLIVSTDRNRLIVENYFVHKILGYCGWRINQEKTQQVPSREVVYQGFVINSETMEYSITEDKKERVISGVQKLKEKIRKGQEIWAKEVAQVVGKCISLRKSHGEGMRVGLREIQHQLGKQVCWEGGLEEPNWEIKVELTESCARELDYVESLLKTVDGWPIPIQGEIEVFNKDGEAYIAPQLYRENKAKSIFVSDASDRVAFVFEAETFHIVEEFGFSEEEKTYGSGHRELLAVLKTLDKHKDRLVKTDTVVYWVTDSQNLYQFLNRGSRKPEIQQTVLKIKVWEHQLGIRIVPIWKPRNTSQIVLADLGSKLYKSTDEWSIDKRTYNRIVRTIGVEVTIDGFATRENAVVTRFYSKYPQVHTEGINFYAQKLSKDEVYWCCPPVKEVVKCIQHILAAKERVVAYVSFPEWKSQNYWPMVTSGRFFAPFVMTSFYSFPKFLAYNDASKTLSGKSSYRFITILINNKFVQNRVLLR